MDNHKTGCFQEQNAARSDALRYYRILDTPAEEAFDRVTILAAHTLNVPIAAIGFVEAHRVWFKSRHGLEVSEVESVPGLCASVVLENEPYIVEDAKTDPRTAQHPMVTGSFGLRFYAAVPLAGRNGLRLGALCVFDRSPRQVSQAQIDVLQHLGKLAEELLELRLAQIAAEERRESLVELAESLPQIIWTATPDGIVDYHSNYFYRYTGLGKVDLATNGWLEALHPDDRERCLRSWDKAIRMGKEYRIEFRILSAEMEEYRWHLVTAQPIRDASGYIRKWYGTAFDIHDRKLAEQSLARREERLRAIIENEPECVKIVTPEGILLDMNPAGLNMIGADEPQQVVGKAVINLIHPDDREAFNALHHRVLSGQSGRLHFRITGLKGTERWMETHSTPLRGANDVIEGVLSVTRDITERRRAEMALSEIRQRNQLILSAIAEGVHGLDARGHIIFENPAALAMLGYQEHEVLGQHSHTLIHHHHADGSVYPAGTCPIYQTLRDGVTRHVDNEVFFRKNGTSFPVEYTVAAMKDELTGVISGAVVNFRDITEEKRDAALRSLEIRVLDMVSTGMTLTTILEEVANTVDRLLPNVLTSILFINEAGRIHHGAAPRLPDDYKRAIESMPIRNDHSNANGATYQRKQAVIADIQLNLLWQDYRDLALKYGLRVSWALPVMNTKSEILAMFVLYSEKQQMPSEQDQFLIARVAQLVNIAIERIRQNEQLRASEARYRSIYNLVPVSIWEEDWTSVIAMVNKLRERGVNDFRSYFDTHPAWVREALRAVKIVNVNEESLTLFEANDKEELINSLETVFSTPDTLPGFIEKLVALTEGKQVAEFEASLRTVRGRRIHALIRMTFPPTDSPSGQVLVSRLDMTAYREAEERFRIIAQATSDVVWDWNLLTNSVWWNDGMYRLFGYEADTLPTDSTSWTMHIHSQHRERVTSKIQAVIEGKEDSWQDEYLFARADGSYALIMDRGFVIRDSDGQPLRMVGSMVDITLQRRLEEQLNQAQRLDAIGQLTGGVAHDFNNLLTVILGNAEVLMESKVLEGKDQKLAQMILTAAERGAELTSRLLAFARKQPLDPKVIDVNKLVSGMDGLLRRLLGEQIEIEVVQRGGLWPALVDASQLENAIMNLCINARDAMPAGGRLTIETANAYLDDAYTAQVAEVRPGQYVMVAVSDSGMGMDEDTLAHAFEPFFTTKEVGKGSGLGLSMVYGFIKQSRGHVKIYTELGQGTTVKLYLPRAVSASKRTDRIEVVDINESDDRKKILLVEDDELVRTYVEEQLKQLGYDVVSVANGPEAIEVLKGIADFDLLFTDIVMPGGMSGRQLADEAQRMYPDLSVLFTSGYTENAIVHHNRLDPGVHLIQKPYSRQSLAAKIRLVLNKDSH